MIRTGIIGMSSGNAHPYSWSAIINGVFDGEEITRVGYPGVTAYLHANQDTLGIPAARVTHVWAQSADIAESIASAAGIPHVAARLEDMIGQVDAVILARDDPEHHREMAEPFISAGIPIFIDKPLTISRDDLAWFTEQVAKGRFIMSCSSMRYAAECSSARANLHTLGPIELVTAVGKKDWVKYGVHMLEAVFALLNDPRPLAVTHTGKAGQDMVTLEFENGVRAGIHLFMDITPTFQLSVFGHNGWRLVEMTNFYAMFRDNIIEFIRSVQEGKPRLPFEKTAAIIHTLIAARESLEQGGKKIHLK
ncbi:Gfo/Idh/MocA family oxidoreductase [Chitinophaga sp.]|uniref:Gfo/Idh/MocA family protein n=1 Tax=Chitinophaga sp. TaxID=1869181 RepID=UPI0031D54A70